MTPGPEDREDIACQADLTESKQTVRVEKLMLSSLGGWLDLDARWGNDTLPVAAWRHITTMGRDQYVKVLRRGFLFPFGHRALLVDEVRRKIRQGPPFAPADRKREPDKSITNEPWLIGEKEPWLFEADVAYLLRRVFLVVLEEEKDYTALAADFPNETMGRDMPLQRVRLQTLVTRRYLARVVDQDVSLSTLLRKRNDILGHGEVERINRNRHAVVARQGRAGRLQQLPRSGRQMQRAPLLRERTRVARPMPLDAPVISTDLPSRPSFMKLLAEPTGCTVAVYPLDLTRASSSARSLVVRCCAFMCLLR